MGQPSQSPASSSFVAREQATKSNSPQICRTFSHPDFNRRLRLLTGSVHDQHRVEHALAGLVIVIGRSPYRRSGITPCPEGLCIRVWHKLARNARERPNNLTKI